MYLAARKPYICAGSGHSSASSSCNNFFLLIFASTYLHFTFYIVNVQTATYYSKTYCISIRRFHDFAGGVLNFIYWCSIVIIVNLSTLRDSLSVHRIIRGFHDLAGGVLNSIVLKRDNRSIIIVLYLPFTY